MRTCPICHRVPCQHPGCPHLARIGREYCWTHWEEER